MVFSEDEGGDAGLAKTHVMSTIIHDRAGVQPSNDSRHSVFNHIPIFFSITH